MPAVWNVNNIYNKTGNTKVSSKLTFEVGEKFSGRVVKSLDNKNEVMVKLVDGWQFAAEVDAPLDQIQDGLVKFQVEGFVDGKLKLKAVGDDSKDKSTKVDAVDDFIKSEGLSSDDKDIINLMIKYNMHLTKDNVNKIKSIINFKEKLNDNPKEADAFIEKYLSIKGIDKNSEQGQKIQKLLKEFFSSLKTIDKSELMMMMENGIDLTKENIDSFKRIAANFSTIFENINDIKNEMDQISFSELEEMNMIDEENISAKGAITGEENQTEQNEINENLNSKGNSPDLVINTARMKMLNDIYSSGNSKINILQLLKSMTANDNDILKYAVKNALSNSKSEFIFNGDFDSLENKLGHYSDKEIIDVFRYEADANGSDLNTISKDDVESGMARMLDRKISISNKDFTKIKDVIKFINESQAQENNVDDNFSNLKQPALDSNLDESIQENSTFNNEEKANQIEPELNNGTISAKDNNMTKETNNKLNISSNDSVKIQFLDKNEQTKAAIKEVLSKVELVNNAAGKSISSDLDTLIDNLIKQVNEQNGDSGKVQSEFKDKMVNSNEKLNTPLTNIDPKDIETGKTDVLKALLDKKELEKIFEVKLSNLDDNSRTKVMDKLSSTIKEQLGNIFSEKMGQNIMELLKNNINDFKVFNNLNNQYYCLDLPLQFKEKDYPCKLIIKDDRKDGKKVDSSNVKLIVTVKTFNLGAIDGYLNLRDKVLNIDLKCDKKFVKPLELGKGKLEDTLRGMGFISNVVVSKKLEDVTLINCRDFFDDKNISAINVTV